MVKADRSVWTALDIVGMMILIAGALGVIGYLTLSQMVSEILIAVGIALIIISSIFIHNEGRKLRKEYEEYERFDEIRNDARSVPNDLNEGYMIDYTEEPSRAISYKNNEPEIKECIAENEGFSDDEVRAYPE
jgi:hypothetical protein